MMLQLNPEILLDTPKGKGIALLVTDRGIDYDLEWTVMLDQSGEIWTFRNSEVRGIENLTWRRKKHVFQVFQSEQPANPEKSERPKRSETAPLVADPPGGCHIRHVVPYDPR